MSDIGVLGVLGNAPIVFVSMDGHDGPGTVSPINEADGWRLGGTTSVCCAHCSAMDFWFIIYPVIHVFKDPVLDTNIYSRFFGLSFYCAQYLNT